MARQVYDCVDAHTCGNPVRVVTNNHPPLVGNSMFEKRQHFLKSYDHIRRGLMFEPRGHDMMSGSFFYPPNDSANDVAILFIETSGCLPMCGHGTIGAITIGIEEGLITPKTPRTVRMETPAGLVIVNYETQGDRVSAVTLTNVPSFLIATNVSVECPQLGELTVDVSYGGNFYAIVDPQKNFTGLQDYTTDDLIPASRAIRTFINENYSFQHPENSAIDYVSHVLWTGDTISPKATARNAVFYGDKAIDRSPCGTGTSARMAQWYAKGKLSMGDSFIHESIIGSTFTGLITQETTVGSHAAIVPSICGWARITGYNSIILDEEDPYLEGFTVL